MHQHTTIEIVVDKMAPAEGDALAAARCVDDQRVVIDAEGSLSSRNPYPQLGGPDPPSEPIPVLILEVEQYTLGEAGPGADSGIGSEVAGATSPPEFMSRASL